MEDFTDPLLAEQQSYALPRPGTSQSTFDAFADPLLDKTLRRSAAAADKADQFATPPAPMQDLSAEGQAYGPTAAPATPAAPDPVARDDAMQAEMFKLGRENAKAAADEYLRIQNELTPTPVDTSKPQKSQEEIRQEQFDEREARLSKGETLTESEYAQHYDQKDRNPARVLKRNELEDNPTTREQLEFRNYLLDTGKYANMDKIETTEWTALEGAYIVRRMRPVREQANATKEAILAQNAADIAGGTKSNPARTALQAQRLKAIDQQVDGFEKEVTGALTGFAANFRREFPFATSGGGAIGEPPEDGALPGNRDAGKAESASDAKKAAAKQKAENEGSLVSDVGAALWGGGKAAAGSGVGLVQSGIDSLFGTRYADSTAKWLAEQEKKTDESFSPETKRQASALSEAVKTGELSTILKGLYDNPRAVAMHGSSMVGQVGATLAAGAAVLATAPASVAGVSATGVGVGLAASQVAEQSGAKIFTNVMEAPIDDLKGSPYWYKAQRDLRAEQGPDPVNPVTDEQVRERMASDARQSVLGTLYIIGAVTAAVGGISSGVITSKVAAETVKGAVAKGAAREGASEFVQEGAQQATEKFATDKAKTGTGTVDLTDPEVRGAAILGGIMGGAFGAVGGAVSRQTTPPPAPAGDAGLQLAPSDPAPPPATPPVQTEPAPAAQAPDVIYAPGPVATPEPTAQGELELFTDPKAEFDRLMNPRPEAERLMAQSPAAFEAEMSRRESFAVQQEESARIAAAEENAKQLSLIDVQDTEARTQAAIREAEPIVAAVDQAVESTRAKRDAAYAQIEVSAFVDTDPLATGRAATRRNRDGLRAEATSTSRMDAMLFEQSAAEADYQNALEQQREVYATVEAAREAVALDIQMQKEEGTFFNEADSTNARAREARAQADALLRQQQDAIREANRPGPAESAAILLRAQREAQVRARANGPQELTPKIKAELARRAEVRAKASKAAEAVTARVVANAEKSKPASQKRKGKKGKKAEAARDPLSILESRVDDSPRPAIDEATLAGVVSGFKLNPSRVQVESVARVTDAPDDVSPNAAGYVKMSPDRSTAQIVLVRENIPDAATARAVVTEEAINHFGVLGLLSETQLNNVILDMFVAINRSPVLQSMWKQVQATYADASDPVQQKEMLARMLASPDTAAAAGFVDAKLRPMLARVGLPGLDGMTPAQLALIHKQGQMNTQNPSAEGARVLATEAGVGVKRDYLQQRQEIGGETANVLTLSRAQEAYSKIFDTLRAAKGVFRFVGESPIDGAQDLALALRNQLVRRESQATQISRERVAPLVERIRASMDAMRSELKGSGISVDSAMAAADRYMLFKHALEQNWRTQVYEANFRPEFEGNRSKVTALLNKARDLGANMTAQQQAELRAELRTLVNDNTVTDPWKIDTENSEIHTLGVGSNNAKARDGIRRRELSRLWQYPSVARHIEVLKAASAEARSMLIDLGKLDAGEVGGLFDMSHYMPQKGGAEADTAKTGSISDQAAATYDRRQMARTGRQEMADNQTGELITQLRAYAIDLGQQGLNRGLAEVGLRTQAFATANAETNRAEAINTVRDMSRVLRISPDLKFRHTDDGLKLFNAKGEIVEARSPTNMQTVRMADGRLHQVFIKSTELQQAMDPEALKEAMGLNRNVFNRTARGAIRAFSQNATSTLMYFFIQLARDMQQGLVESFRLAGVKGVKNYLGEVLSALSSASLSVSGTGTIGTLRTFDAAGLAAAKAKNPQDFLPGGRFQFAEEFAASNISLLSPDRIQTRTGLEAALTSDPGRVSRITQQVGDATRYALEKARVPFDHVETSLRYAQYAVARRSGMSPEAATDFTINQIDFAQKSYIGQKLNAILLFAQTALNGVDALVTRRVWKNGRAPIEFVRQADGSHRAMLSSDWASQLSPGAAAAYTLPSMVLAGLAMGMAGSDETGRNEYERVDGDVTANNHLIWLGKERGFMRVPLQDGLQGLLGGFAVTMMRGALGHIPPSEVARVTYNLTRRHVVPLGRSEVTEDDIRRPDWGPVGGVLMAQLAAAIPMQIQALSNIGLNRDGFGRPLRIIEDEAGGRIYPKNAPRSNALDKANTALSQQLTEMTGGKVSISPQAMGEITGALAGLFPFGLNVSAAARASDRPERGTDEGTLEGPTQVPLPLRMVIDAALRPERSGRGYEFRQYQEFRDNEMVPLVRLENTAIAKDKEKAEYTSRKGSNPGSGPRRDAFLAENPQLKVYREIDGSRTKEADALNTMYRKAVVDDDASKQAQINMARQRLSRAALDAMHAAKDGDFKEAERLRKSFPGFRPK